MRYQEIIEARIDELFKQIIPYTWTYQGDDYWEGRFIADNKQYQITATKEVGFVDESGNETPYWEMSFGLIEDSFAGAKVIGTNGNELIIFSTVLAGFKEFLKNKQPDMVGISASKKNHNRFKLYQHLAKRMTPELASLGYRPFACPKYAHVDTTKHFDSICFARY